MRTTNHADDGFSCCHESLGPSSGSLEISRVFWGRTVWLRQRSSAKNSFSPMDLRQIDAAERPGCRPRVLKVVFKPALQLTIVDQTVRSRIIICPGHIYVARGLTIRRERTGESTLREGSNDEASRRAAIGRSSGEMASGLSKALPRARWRKLRAFFRRRAIRSRSMRPASGARFPLTARSSVLGD